MRRSRHGGLLSTITQIAEIVVSKLWPQEADRFATLSFSLGLVFSVLLTLTPRSSLEPQEFSNLWGTCLA